MSKMVVYVLDKFVWLLIITVLTGQALQIAGVVDTPKGLELGEITYSQGNEYEYKMSVGDVDGRGKRQAGDRSPLIDNLFNVPIATLTAVNDLVQASRPALQRIREITQRRIDAYRENVQRSQRSNKEKHHYGQGPKVQEDGSSSRVLLRV